MRRAGSVSDRRKIPSPVAHAPGSPGPLLPLVLFSTQDHQTLLGTGVRGEGGWPCFISSAGGAPLESITFQYIDAGISLTTAAFAPAIDSLWVLIEQQFDPLLLAISVPIHDDEFVALKKNLYA